MEQSADGAGQPGPGAATLRHCPCQGPLAEAYNSLSRLARLFPQAAHPLLLSE